MPTKDTHIRIAEENEAFLSSFSYAVGPARGWASTVSFYAALHYIEAFFSTKFKHSPDHRTRDNNMVQHTETMTIYDEYCELKNISTRARYYGLYPSESDLTDEVFSALTSVKLEMRKYC